MKHAGYIIQILNIDSWVYTVIVLRTTCMYFTIFGCQKTKEKPKDTNFCGEVVFTIDVLVHNRLLHVQTTSRYEAYTADYV